MALFGPNKLFLPILVFPFNRFGISEVLVQENAQQVFLFCFVLLQGGAMPIFRLLVLRHGLP